MEIVYSFYHSNDKGKIKSKEELKEYIEKLDKEIKYTCGFEFKNPSINKVLITKEKALKKLKEPYLDVSEDENFIYINTYSENDMW